MDWNGAFVPRLSKSIGKVTYIPMWKMTHSDWKVLDWNALRNAAKNDIVRAASEDRIAGFMHVNFLQKGSQAAGYYIPVGAAMLVDLEAQLEKPPLTNSKDDAELTTRAERFDAAVAAAELLLIMASTEKPTTTDDNAEAPALSDKDKIAKMMLASMLEVINDEREKKEAQAYIQQIIDEDFVDITDLDLTLTWAMSVLAEKDIAWLEEWSNEADQILGEAQDKNLV